MALSTVYYFPVDAEGVETGEALPITLQSDGSADLSELPDSLQRTLETFGASDALRRSRVFPADGAAFLTALLGMTNPFLRFRERSTSSFRSH